MIWLRSALFNLVFIGGTVLTVLFGTLLLAAPAWVMVALYPRLGPADGGAAAAGSAASASR